MSENLIIALIGVISSVVIFLMTLIANLIAYKNKVRHEVKRQITEQLTKIISNIIDVIPIVKSNLEELTNEYNSCIVSGKDIMYNVDVLNKNVYFTGKTVDLFSNFVKFQAYIRYHILPLRKYLIYHDKLKELISKFKNKYLDYMSSIEKSEYTDISILKNKNDNIELVLDEIYFHLYNLYIDIQNDTYSVFFKKYKMNRMKDSRFKELRSKI